MEERIGDYLVRRLIGEGGMGSVYEAEERLSGRRVALKVLHPELMRSEEVRQRFLKEMRILSEIEHPNVVRSLSSTEIDGKLVLVLEYLDGRTLREELIAQSRLPVVRAVEIAKAIAAALIAAHEREQPVVHRDLKPENLMILEGGGVKVMDFGIAKTIDEVRPRTAATQVVGTVQYMTPEQADGRAVTTRTDLYALGLVLYEMLAGEPPFGGASLVALLRAQCETPPPAFPPDVRDILPTRLTALVFKLLEKKPEDRPASAREVHDSLAAIAAPLSADPLGAATAPMATSPVSPSARTELAATADRSLPGRTAAPSAARSKPRKPPLDTIELMNRLEKKRSRLWLLAPLGALLAAGVTYFAMSGSFAAPTKKTKRSASPSATVSAPPASAAPPASLRVGGNRFLRWQVPAGWTEFRADDAFTIAAYRLPRTPGDAEDAVLTVRAPSRGPVEAIKTTQEQFNPCTAGCDKTQLLAVAGQQITLYELHGDFLAHGSRPPPKLRFAVLGAMVPSGATFYKIQLLGPEASVIAARAEFDAFVKSVRPVAL